MQSLMLSNWTTLRTPSSVSTTIKQPESQWLDVGDYQDLIGWLEIKEYSPTSGATLVFAYQLSPTKDDAYFASSTASSLNIAGTGVTIAKMLIGSTSFNARWLRYQVSCSSSVAWDITFRAWISANVGSRRKKTHARCTCGRVLDQAAHRCGCGRSLRSVL
jgi:hypothetical protein